MYKSSVSTHLFKNEEVSWEALEDAKSARVAVYCPYEKDAVENDDEVRDKLFAWISNNVRVMREVSNKYFK